MARKNDKIIYLHLHKPIEGKMDFYFASLTDMYDKIHINDIGVTRQTLWNYKFFERCFYANKFCTLELVTLE